jgi:hypothetical protein
MILEPPAALLSPLVIIIETHGGGAGLWAFTTTDERATKARRERRIV